MTSIFLDSADTGAIVQWGECRFVRGVTTNPSLVSKNSGSRFGDKVESGTFESMYVPFIKNIAQVLDSSKSFGAKKHLSVEVISLEPAKMVLQAHAIRATLGCFTNIDLFIKIPVSFETLEVISELEASSIKVNATACMTALQAKLALDCGASAVSFFYNRIIDAAEDPDKAIRDFVDLRANESCDIICGSIRRAENVHAALKAGADIVTVSEKIILEMCKHHQTDLAIKQFQGDIEKWLK